MLADFTILRPGSVAEACRLLQEHDGEVAAYAGGTELLLAMKLGFADYPLLLDLKGLPELGSLAVTPQEVRIGAAVTHRRLERSPEIAAALPSLVALERRVANPRVRAIGTIGGNLAFGEPHSDPATYLVATGARLVCQRADGTRRTVPAAEFLTGPFETILEPGELLVEVWIPRPAAGAAIAHQRMVLTERPAAAVTAAVTVDGGLVTAARIAVGAATPVPIRVPATEELLAGAAAEGLLDPAGDLLPRAGTAAAETVTIESGADVTYRRQLVAVLVRRAVHDALRAPAAVASSRPSRGGLTRAPAPMM